MLAMGAGLVSLTGLSPLSSALGAACATDAAEKEQREALHYVETSENPRELCRACMSFKAPGPKPARCGTCQMLNNTAVNPAGSCDAWSSK